MSVHRLLLISPVYDIFASEKSGDQYQEFHENRCPIGPGTIESGIKQLKARLSAAGMQWSRSGAQRMLILRSAVLGHDFDRLWCRAA